MPGFQPSYHTIQLYPKASPWAEICRPFRPKINQSTIRRAKLHLSAPISPISVLQSNQRAIKNSISVLLLLSVCYSLVIRNYLSFLCAFSVSSVVKPESRIPNPAPRTSHPAPRNPHPAPRTPHLVPPHLAPRIPHPSLFTAKAPFRGLGVLTIHCSLLTIHSFPPHQQLTTISVLINIKSLYICPK